MHSNRIPALLAVLGAALILFGFAGLAGAATREPSTKAAVERAITQYRSGFRHSDGKLACGRMTLAYRKQILGAVVKAVPGLSGWGCERVVNAYGREVYTSWTGSHAPMRGLRFRGDCASYRRGAERFRVRRVDGRWRTDVGTRCTAGSSVRAASLDILALEEDEQTADLVTEKDAVEVGGEFGPVGAGVVSEPDARCDALLSESAEDGAEDEWLSCLDELQP